MKKMKVAILTGSRAEWGLFFPLAREIQSNKKAFNLQIVVSGAHLLPEFGLTYKEIKKDGFSINSKVKLPINSDSPLAIAESISVGVKGFSKALASLKPDLVFLLGDRFETFAAAAACTLLKIPIAHIHGGELTYGSLDETFRHAITKMACLHFTATKSYRKRVIQMGESPARVFNVGALGIDNIKNANFLKKEEFEKRIKTKLGKRNIILTYNPPTFEDKKTVLKEFGCLLKAVSELKDIKVIITKPNPDIYSKAIIEMIDSYTVRNEKRVVSFASLGRELYLSALKLMDVVAGNSSSGIIEAPSFRIPTVNVGKRQEARVRADSVIDTKSELKSIRKAFKKAFSKNFKSHCRRVKNPYGQGKTAEKIVAVIKKKRFLSPAKEFFDLNFNL
jgi:GDP/UDP-N,N'-diacetylbacillosamine 2-epimerase (hydrolysing)